MRSLIAAGLILVAGSAWADTTDQTTAVEQEAQATHGSQPGAPANPNVPPEIAAWTGTGFYPTEFCYMVHSLDRSVPQYWSIRRWCDKRERRGSSEYF